MARLLIGFLSCCRTHAVTGACENSSLVLLEADMSCSSMSDASETEEQLSFFFRKRRMEVRGVLARDKF